MCNAFDGLARRSTGHGARFVRYAWGLRVKYLAQQKKNSRDFAGGCTTAGLSLSSLLISRVVGMIYVCPHEEIFKISYPDFWGDRQDHYANIDDISAEETKFFGLYQMIRRRDSNESFKLLRKYGEISDFEAFAKITDTAKAK